MKNLIRKAFFLVGLGIYTFADFGGLSLSDLDSGGGTISLISNGGANVLNLNIAKNFKFGEFNIEMGLNLVTPEDKRPAGLNLIEFRHAEYDNKTIGLRYGLLNNVTLGYGLIMDTYDSSPGITYFDGSKAGIKAYTKLYKPVCVYAVATNKRLYGIRLSYDIAYMPGINKSLVIGVTSVSDQGGVKSGSALINQNVSGYSFDAGFNLVQDLIDVFLEYGTLSNNSNGITTGLKYYLNENFTVKTEFRSYGNNFVPGLFNSTYEKAPVDLNIYSSGPVTGVFAGFEARLLPLGIINAGYSLYQDKAPALKAAVAFREFMGYTGVINYEKLVFSGAPYVVTAVVSYKINILTSAQMSIEKIGDNDATYSLAYKLNF
ncbi:MAG: hypothetical protein PHV30_01350 [Candidatus Margulisbacteria bacterium]|nr:hypothetical protein [Candidatus Margulisiibacteriota bacterium]